jgi:Fe-S oxidoreductase
MEIRIKGAMPRMQALKEVEKNNGVNTLAAICAICKSQFSKVLPKFDFDPYMIVSVHQLVSNAIILNKPQTDTTSTDKAEEAETE